MQTSITADEVAEVHVRNIGGIDETTIELPPGVNVLTGRNATNRTSLLRAIMGALGSDAVSLKADADEGEASLTLGETVYTREFARENDTVVKSGEPYLAESEVADLFAFLLESNEARGAIRQGTDLRDIIMRPVDTDAIHAEIAELQDERKAISERLDELEALKRDLPELEAQRQDLTEQIESKQVALDEKEAEVDEANVDLEESKAKKQEFETQLDELRETRSELERVRFRIESQEESLEALRNELDELEATNLSGVPTEEKAEVEAEIEQLRGRQQRLNVTLGELQSIVSFNEEMLEGEGGGIKAYLEDGGAESGTVTDQLVEADAVVCWTCGTDVDRSAIESTVDRLRSLRDELLDERSDVQERLGDLQMERDRLEEQRKRQQQLERRRDELVSEIDEREEQLAAFRDQREELRATVETLEAGVSDLPEQDYGEVIELHKEANQLEFELEMLEDERDEIDERIESVEADLSAVEELETRQEAIVEELADLRTKVEQIEQEAVEQFNEHMDALLTLLNYENLERVWIERIQREVKEGRRNAIKSVFELYIVRQTETGTAYEDTIDHLSESEREVTGLVFALAGYLAHDVYETVPFMLLDSLEAIDSERIATLVEYLTDYTGYLLVALLPEDASVLPDEYERIIEI